MEVNNRIVELLIKKHYPHSDDVYDIMRWIADIYDIYFVVFKDFDEKINSYKFRYAIFNKYGKGIEDEKRDIKSIDMFNTEIDAYNKCIEYILTYLV